MRAAMTMARNAATAKTRLIHFDMAGRYSLKAAASLPPFMMPREGPATTGEQEALRLPLLLRSDPHSGSSFWSPAYGPPSPRAEGTRGGPR